MGPREAPSCAVPEGASRRDEAQDGASRGDPPLVVVTYEKKQLKSRVPAHVVRRQVERFNNGESSCKEVCERLEISRTRLYELRTQWLKNRHDFVPGTSGGDRYGKWPESSENLAFELLQEKPVNYALIADEMARQHQFVRSRGAVRDYLLSQFPLLVQSARPGPKPRRRWQCSQSGQIWQHDATPVRIWPSARPQALISTVDDHTRKVIRASIWESETLWAHFLHLRAAFCEHGIPEMLYTDGFSMFGYEGEDAVTKCGRMLLALQIAHRVAPSPQAKGKIERMVGTLQRRLVPVLKHAGVQNGQDAQPIVDSHVAHWNQNHKNRTIGMTANAAHLLAVTEKRIAYRPCPPQRLMDLHMAYHEPRTASKANTIDYQGTTWNITPTSRKNVALVIHPQRQFWVVESMPDPRKPQWPNILGKFTL